MLPAVFCRLGREPGLSREWRASGADTAHQGIKATIAGPADSSLRKYGALASDLTDILSLKINLRVSLNHLLSDNS